MPETILKDDVGKIRFQKDCINRKEGLRGDFRVNKNSGVSLAQFSAEYRQEAFFLQDLNSI